MAQPTAIYGFPKKNPVASLSFSPFSPPFNVPVPFSFSLVLSLSPFSFLLSLSHSLPPFPFSCPFVLFPFFFSFFLSLFPPPFPLPLQMERFGNL